MPTITNARIIGQVTGDLTGSVFSPQVISVANITTGTLGITHGGTGLTSVGASGSVLTSDGTNLVYTTVTGGGSGINGAEVSASFPTRIEVSGAISGSNIFALLTGASFSGPISSSVGVSASYIKFPDGSELSSSIILGNGGISGAEISASFPIRQEVSGAISSSLTNYILTDSSASLSSLVSITGSFNILSASDGINFNTIDGTFIRATNGHARVYAASNAFITGSNNVVIYAGTDINLTADDNINISSSNNTTIAAPNVELTGNLILSGVIYGDGSGLTNLPTQDLSQYVTTGTLSGAIDILTASISSSFVEFSDLSSINELSAQFMTASISLSASLIRFPDGSEITSSIGLGGIPSVLSTGNITGSGLFGNEIRLKNDISLNSITASISGTEAVFGSLLVDGTLIAKELYITYQTSSVLYSSGSTKFGDSLDDTHQFTGSLLTTNITSNVITASYVSASTIIINNPLATFNTIDVDVLNVNTKTRLTGALGFTGSANIYGTLNYNGVLLDDLLGSSLTPVLATTAYNRLRYLTTSSLDINGEALINLTNTAVSGNAYFSTASLTEISVDVMVDTNGDGRYKQDLLAVELFNSASCLWVSVSAPAAMNRNYRLIAINESQNKFTFGS